MSEQSEKFRWVAEGFTQRVEQVPADAWDNQSPVPEWKARDVVDHLVTWIPGFFVGQWGIEIPDHPPASEDPVVAWAVVRDALQGYLDDPEVASQVRDTPMGPLSFEAAFDQIATADVFLHTWDLARATGGDERLDPGEVHTMLVGMEPMDEVLRQSGHYGPRVDVPDDAPEQDKLLAFIGRTP